MRRQLIPVNPRTYVQAPNHEVAQTQRIIIIGETEAGTLQLDFIRVMARYH
jgi:hypothetical protein